MTKACLPGPAPGAFVLRPVTAQLLPQRPGAPRHFAAVSQDQCERWMPAAVTPGLLWTEGEGVPEGFLEAAAVPGRGLAQGRREGSGGPDRWGGAARGGRWTSPWIQVSSRRPGRGSRVGAWRRRPKEPRTQKLRSTTRWAWQAALVTCLACAPDSARQGPADLGEEQRPRSGTRHPGDLGTCRQAGGPSISVLRERALGPAPRDGAQSPGTWPEASPRASRWTRPPGRSRGVGRRRAPPASICPGGTDVGTCGDRLHMLRPIHRHSDVATMSSLCARSH